MKDDEQENDGQREEPISPEDVSMNMTIRRQMAHQSAESSFDSDYKDSYFGTIRELKLALKAYGREQYLERLADLEEEKGEPATAQEKAKILEDIAQLDLIKAFGDIPLKKKDVDNAFDDRKETKNQSEDAWNTIFHNELFKIGKLEVLLTIGAVNTMPLDDEPTADDLEDQREMEILQKSFYPEKEKKKCRT